MKNLKIMLVVLFVFLFVGTGNAAPDAEEQQDTRFYVTPFAWFVGMDGTIGARGRTTEVDFSFSDVRDYVDFAAMLGLEVVFDNTNGILSNINLIQLAKQKPVRGVTLEGDTQILLSDIAAFHRFHSAPFGERKTSVMNLDFLAGVRIWDIDVGLYVDTPLMGSHNVSKSRSWVDPFVGLRAQFLMNERLRLTLLGGIGTSNTWDASAQVAWKIGRSSSLLLGYRALGVDRREGEGNEQFVFDTTIDGPMLGFTFEF